jgi:hypothetical protein
MPNIRGTSNTVLATITGLPTHLIPSTDQRYPIILNDEGEARHGGVYFANGSSVITLYSSKISGSNLLYQGNFGLSGNKGILQTIITYYLG